MTAEEQRADTLPPGPLAGVHVGSDLYRRARAGYIAYREQRGVTIFGELPEWETLPMHLVLAWTAVALAITSQPTETTEGASGK
jgi:hypothetical protein